MGDTLHLASLSLESRYAAAAIYLQQQEDIVEFLVANLEENLGRSRPPLPGDAPDALNRGPLWRPGGAPGVMQLPDGWRHLDDIDLCMELGVRVRTLKAVPRCIR